MSYDELYAASRKRMHKVQEILAKFGSLANGRGGDVFNKGVTKHFGPNPYSPKSGSHLNKDLNVYLKAPQPIEPVNIRTQMSVGGAP
jgi:hypothetical protein